jgi:hypothetical protein
MSEGLYLLATGQPMFESSTGPSEGTMALTLDDRKALADLDDARITACLDHAGGQLSGGRQFKVPYDKRIGRMRETFVNLGAGPNHGRLLHVIKVSKKFPDIIDQIVDDIKEKRQPTWGVSLGTDYVRSPPGTRPEILAKAVSHVGLTRDPQYANWPDATLIHLAARSKAGFYKALKEQVLDACPEIYMSEKTRARIEAALAKSVPARPLVPEASPLPLRTAIPTAPTTPITPTMTEAAIAAVQQGLSDEQKYKQFRERYEKFAGAVYPDDRAKANGPPLLTGEHFTEAQRLFHDINAISRGKGYSDMPDNAHDAYGSLKKYLNYAHEVASREGGKYFKDSPAALANLKAGLDLQSIVQERPNDNPFGPVQTVLAMHAVIEEDKLANHETQRVAFENDRKAFVEKEIEAQAAVKRAEEEISGHKRKYEEAVAEAVKAKEAAENFEKELKVKKARLEALEAAASVPGTGAPGSSRLVAELGTATSVLPGASAAGLAVGQPQPPMVESAAASRTTTGSSLPGAPPIPHLDENKFGKLFDPAPMYAIAHSGATSTWFSKASDPAGMAAYRFFKN